MQSLAHLSSFLTGRDIEDGIGLRAVSVVLTGQQTVIVLLLQLCLRGGTGEYESWTVVTQYNRRD